MGHYFDVDFELEMSPFGLELLDTLREMNGDWKATADVLWEQGDRIREIAKALGRLEGWFDILTTRPTDRPHHLVYHATHKSKGQPFEEVLPAVLPYLTRMPTRVVLFHELWERAHVLDIQPKGP